MNGKEKESGEDVKKNEGGEGARGRRQKYTKRLPLAVMLEVKESRDRHGLKHHDYARYRVYLGKRLRRLYAATGMTHGRGKRFVQRPINARSIRNDPRALLVPLLRAERCWAAAMETKARQEAEAPTATAGRLDSEKNAERVAAARRSFVARKLKRASSFAQCLQRIAARRCGSVSALEAEAYSAWLQGTLEMEHERAGAETDGSRWVRALEMLTRARSVYDHLSRRADGPPRVAAAAAASAEYRDALEPSIRYCQYKLGEDGGGGGGAGAGLEALQAIAAADASLQAKLAKVLAQARDEAAEESVREINWHGVILPVESQAVRVCLHGAREIEARLDAKADDGGGNDGGAGSGSVEQMELYDALFVHLNDARGLIRQQRAALAEGDTAERVLAQLDDAIAENSSRRMIQRTEAMIGALKSRVDARTAQSSMGGPREDRAEPSVKDRGARPDDLVRLYENQQQSIEALGELAEASTVLEDAGVLQECVAMRLCVQAHRCYYVALSYAVSEKTTEAFVLAGRAADYVEEAEGRVDGIADTQMRERLRASLAALLSDISTQRCIYKVRAYARVLETESQLRAQVDRMSLGHDDNSTRGAERMVGDIPLASATAASALSSSLSVFRSALVLKGSDPAQLPKLADVPPSLVSLPGRAITLDTAINDIPSPRADEEDEEEDEDDEEDEKEAQDEAAASGTGFISSLFGWGGGRT